MTLRGYGSSLVSGRARRTGRGRLCPMSVPVLIGGARASGHPNHEPAARYNEFRCDCFGLTCPRSDSDGNRGSARCTGKCQGFKRDPPVVRLGPPTRPGARHSARTAARRSSPSIVVRFRDEGSAASRAGRRDERSPAAPLRTVPDRPRSARRPNVHRAAADVSGWDCSPDTVRDPVTRSRRIASRRPGRKLHDLQSSRSRRSAGLNPGELA